MLHLYLKWKLFSDSSESRAHANGDCTLGPEGTAPANGGWTLGPEGTAPANGGWTLGSTTNISVG